MTLDAFIHSLCVGWWQAPAALVMLAAAASGAGALLLPRGYGNFIRIGLGAVLVAMIGLLPHHLLPPWADVLLLLPLAGYGVWSLPRRPGWKKLPVVIAAAMWGVFTLASALLPPYGWDEQVYQTALLVRHPGLPVLADNPYSAYPLLPHFFLGWGIRIGGLHLPRLAIWGVTLLLAGELYRRLSARTKMTSAAAVLTATVMISPVSLVLQRDFYAESFIALFAFAGWIVLEKTDADRRDFVLAGVFAGACAAVKLTGAGAALMLAVCALQEKRRFGWFVLGAALTALPFYLRPFIAVGDPVYPYGALVFGGGARVMTAEFHRALGSYRYGLSGLPGAALGWIFCCFAEKVYDGVVCGFSVLSMTAWLIVAVLMRRERTVYLKFGAVLAGYLFWAFTSQQTRFVYPLLFPAALLLAENFDVFRGRGRTAAAVVLALAFCVALPQTWPHLRHFFTAWRILPAARRDRPEFLARVAGRGYIDALTVLCRTAPPDAKVLLLFERRSLYVPRKVVHGTPFFQECRFTPPPTSPEQLYVGLRDADYILLGDSRRGADHLEAYDQVEAAMLGQLAELVRSGRLRMVAPRLFEVRHD